VRLTPSEVDRATVFLVAELARRHRAKGLRLNHPEAVALICDEMHEAARAGASYDEVRTVGAGVLSEDDVLDGVADLLDSLRIECVFADGTRVLIVERPIRRARTPGNQP